MTREEAISFGEDRLELFGGQMGEFIELSVKVLTQLEKGDLVSRKDVLDLIDGEAWNYCDYLVSKYKGGSPEAEAVSHFADNLRERLREVES